MRRRAALVAVLAAVLAGCGRMRVMIDVGFFAPRRAGRWGRATSPPASFAPSGPG